MSISYISIGTNIANRKTNINKSLKLINKYDDINILSKSSIYLTDPLYYANQEKFYNLVIKAETFFDPLELLNVLKNIEFEMGRMKTLRYRERIIDLDILLYDNLIISLNKLIIPHKKMFERKFVLIPLKEIEPNFYFDSINKNINDALNTIDDTSNVIKLDNIKK